MAKFENYYFKATFGSPAFMSGLPLPSPDESHTFINCDFNACLWEILAQQYQNSTFIDCNYWQGWSR